MKPVEHLESATRKQELRDAPNIRKVYCVSHTELHGLLRELRPGGPVKCIVIGNL